MEREEREGLWRLETRTKPHMGDHSFNGVMFDVENIGIDTVSVAGVVVGGEIGQYTVWGKLESIQTGYKTKSGWELLAQGELYNDRPEVQLPLLRPLVVPAGSVGALYVHSAVQNDRGIYYQSCRHDRGSVDADENIRLLPGNARVSPSPFDDSDDADELGGFWWGGWRSSRAFCGQVLYKPIRTIWRWDNHLEFTPEFQRTIVHLMCIWEFREDSVLAMLPQEVLFQIFANLDWRDFQGQ